MTDQGNITVYDYVLAYFPAKARLTLNEKGYKYNTVHTDVITCQNLTPSFLALNPHGTLPVLKNEKDNTMLTESADIMEYLDRLDGKPMGGGVANKEVKTWVDLLKNWNGNLYVDIYSDNEKAMAPLKKYRVSYCEARAKENPSLAATYAAKIAYINHVATSEEIEENKSQLKNILEKAEASFEKGNAFVAGSEYSLADVHLTTLFVRLQFAKRISAELTGKPLASQWFNRMKERPSFQPTFQSFLIQKNLLFAVLPAIPKLFCSAIGIN